MRELQFKHFLSDYVNKLSLNRTNNFNKLFFEAEFENYRLREVLLLLLAEKDLFKKYMHKLSQYPKLFKAYLLNNEYFKNKDYENESLSEAYRKVYNSYLVQKNKYQHNEHVKSLMVDKLLKMKEDKKVSTYRLYTHLKLNPGNVNYALKHKDTKKLSLKNLRDMLNFVESV